MFVSAYKGAVMQEGKEQLYVIGLLFDDRC